MSDPQNFISVYDYRAFYKNWHGRLVRRLIRDVLSSIWPEVKNLRVIGCGYAVPYLGHFTDQAERVCALMQADFGVHAWDEKNKATLCDLEDLPLESHSVDRLLLVHALEHAADPAALLAEAGRILKSNGRMIIVVPNRLGLWAQAEWTPFGHGLPYSATQIINRLKDAGLVHEQTRHALFVPPLRRVFWVRLLRFLEKAGARFFPALGGVHVIEASKQVYAPTGHKKKARNPARLVPAAKPIPASPKS